jgi:type IV pilus assembly protein PilV
MTRQQSTRSARAQRGATLIEILVSMVILLVGLLGLIGVMIQSQRAQLESYQRSQALMLVQDMASRISTNRVAADCYDDEGTLGTGKASADIDVTACTAGSAAQKARATADLQDWNELLKGGAETLTVSGAVTQVGAVLNARGCITKDGAGVFQVSVAWQGAESSGAPPAGITCGTGLYGADDANRRAVSITVFPTIAL